MEVLLNPTHPTEDLICDMNKFSSNTFKVPWNSLNTLKSSSVFFRKWPAVESTSGEPMRLMVQLRNVLLLPYLYGEFVRLLFWEQAGKLWKRTDGVRMNEWMNALYPLQSISGIWNESYFKTNDFKTFDIFLFTTNTCVVTKLRKYCCVPEVANFTTVGL